VRLLTVKVQLSRTWKNKTCQICPTCPDWKSDWAHAADRYQSQSGGHAANPGGPQSWHLSISGFWHVSLQLGLGLGSRRTQQLCSFEWLPGGMQKLGFDGLRVS
jgi:hypothetical protein